MIFVDTNYFVRFLLRDNKSQYLEAKQLFLDGAKGQKGFISSTVVFFEVFWVLRSVYGKDKEALVQILRKLLGLHVEFHESQTLLASIDIFARYGLSLEDCYNLVFAKTQKIQSFKTFDLKLAKVFKTKFI